MNKKIQKLKEPLTKGDLERREIFQTALRWSAIKLGLLKECLEDKDK